MKLFLDGREVSVREINYPAGEVGIVVKSRDRHSDAVVVMDIWDMQDLMKLGMIVETLRNVNQKIKITAKIGFLAYGRQDARKQGMYEAMGCSVMSTFLNSLFLDEIIISDQHSPKSIEKLHKVRLNNIHSLAYTTIKDNIRGGFVL